MAYAGRFRIFLEEGGLVPMGRKTVGKLASIVRLDTLDGAGERLYKMFHKLSRRIGVALLESFYEMPSGIFINGYRRTTKTVWCFLMKAVSTSILQDIMHVPQNRNVRWTTRR